MQRVIMLNPNYTYTVLKRKHWWNSWQYESTCSLEDVKKYIDNFGWLAEHIVISGYKVIIKY